MPAEAARHPVRYTGRFAPSPTGPLHFGSLACALASFLDARNNGGRWLLRIEDTDHLRNVPGAADAICASLAAHGLQWDGEVIWQSRRLPLYDDALARLGDHSFACACTRKMLSAGGGLCDGRCKGAPAATRLRTPGTVRWDDAIQGPQSISPEQSGHPALRRRDGIIAYQLATAVDDADQNISHIVRGADLLDSTACQLVIIKQLGRQKPPAYAHIPVALDAGGAKLCKQHGAAALDPGTASANLHRALQWLGQRPPPSLPKETPEQVLQWGMAHWNLGAVPAQRQLPLPTAAP